MYYNRYEDLASHFDESHYRCYEAQCKDSLTEVFETEAELEYHQDKYHRKVGRTKGGKNKINASNLLGCNNLDGHDESDSLQENPLFEMIGVSPQEFVEKIEEMIKAGFEVPPEITQSYSEIKSQLASKGKKTLIKDTIGKDLTWIVS